MLYTLTPLADVGVVALPPDIVWLKRDGAPAGTGFGVRGDFAVARRVGDGPDGLVAKNPLLTAVIMLLFTDCRVDEIELGDGRDGDRRGWPGDGFDVDTAVGEQALGSKLWLLRRRDLNDQTAMWAQAEAKRALRPLIVQGAAASVTALATPDFVNDRMTLAIGLYARSGAQIFSETFDLLWKLATGGV